MEKKKAEMRKKKRRESKSIQYCSSTEALQSDLSFFLLYIYFLFVFLFCPWRRHFDIIFIVYYLWSHFTSSYPSSYGVSFCETAPNTTYNYEHWTITLNSKKWCIYSWGLPLQYSVPHNKDDLNANIIYYGTLYQSYFLIVICPDSDTNLSHKYSSSSQVFSITMKFLLLGAGVWPE